MGTWPLGSVKDGARYGPMDDYMNHRSQTQRHWNYQPKTLETPAANTEPSRAETEKSSGHENRADSQVRINRVINF